MSALNKKELERLYLDRFVEMLGDFPRGEIHESESPDFLVKSGGTTLGIEITRLFHKPATGQRPLKEQESLGDRIINEARQNYDRLGLPPVHVTVSFNRGAVLRKSDVQPIATRLVVLARKLCPQLNEFSTEEFDWENRHYFPEQVSHITVGRFSALTKSFWGASGAAFFPEMSALEIQSQIAEKDAKVAGYLKSCSAIWLIICSNGEGVSSWFDISKDAIGETYRAQFERVFWFSLQGKAYDLRVRQ